MSDTNLDPSITALTNRASTVAVTATARELMNISRLAPSLEKTENTDLEVAINARAEDLAPTATATELKSIGKAIGNVLEPETFVAGGTLPNQAQNSGNFLATNGTAESWGGLSVSTLSEVNISSIMNDETLVYNHVSGLFENNSQVFRIQEIGLTENIPASGAFEGQVVFDQQTSELKYWDGSEWKVAAVVAAAGGSTVTYKIVVGAYGATPNGAASGAAYTYDLDGTNEFKIIPTDGATDNYFGIATAVGNDKIVIGAHAVDDNGGDSGAVYVYDLDGSNEVKITSSDSAAGDNFGYSVAVGDNKIVVGARYDDDNGNNSGSVYVYDLDGTNEVKITASDGLELDKFGESVAVGDNKIVVAAMYDDQFDSNSAGGQVQFGSVYVYDLDGTNEVRITASDGAQFDYFGSSVAVGDNKIVVGAFETDVNGQNSGSVYVYDLDGTNEVKINASDGSESALFGSSVVVSDSKIYVGAKSDNTFGAVYVYNLDGSGEVKITASDGAAYDYFGHSIAVGGNKIIVGAYLQDDNGNQSGSVYVYDLDGSNEVQFAASDGAANNYFGVSVSTGSFTTSSGGSGSSFPVVDWTGADGTQRTKWQSGWYGSVTSTKLSNGTMAAIASGNNGHMLGAFQVNTTGARAPYLDELWSVTPSPNMIRDDGLSMSAHGDYVATREGGRIQIRNAATGAMYRQNISDLAGVGYTDGEPFGATGVRMYGDYVFIGHTGQANGALINFQTETLVWKTTPSGGATGAPNPGWTLHNDYGTSFENYDIGENYLAIQNSGYRPTASGAAHGGVHIVDYSGNEVSFISNPNTSQGAGAEFGGPAGRENGIAISGDKVVIGSYKDGYGKAYIFDMPTGTLEYTIDENTAGGSTISTASKGQYIFGQEIDAYEDYAVISKYHEAYVVQVSTGTIVAHIPSINIDRQTIVGPYAIGGDVNTGNLRVFNGT